MSETYLELSSDTNQARGLAEYAKAFMQSNLEDIDPKVVERVELFYQDSVACAVSALVKGTNAPNLLRQEAINLYPSEQGAMCYGSSARVHAEKAIAANSSAAREWDSNGTVFGYNTRLNHRAGEFGHNDYYPVAIAAAQEKKLGGEQVLLGMLLSDEIRGRLAEVYSLKDKRIDHVVHGAIASALTYGAMHGASVDELESAVGLFCAHYIPFRAIRYGKQLSDSKGASAAISTEAAIQCVKRSMAGFVGPADIFRNPEALWCLFEKSKEQHSPFDITLTQKGSDFAVMDMHFKMGLYEHQSAGAVQGLIDLLSQDPRLLENESGIQAINVSIYNPAYHIICDKAKWNPQTRQSADHSLPYIISTLLRKAIEHKKVGWQELMLLPDDYSQEALHHPLTRKLMDRVKILHGGDQYDQQYPEGIPTSISIEHQQAGQCASPFVMFPLGHARNTDKQFQDVFDAKFKTLAHLGVDDVDALKDCCRNLAQKSAAEVIAMTDFKLKGSS